jgi:hypothetical protein
LGTLTRARSAKSGLLQRRFVGRSTSLAIDVECVLCASSGSANALRSTPSPNVSHPPSLPPARSSSHPLILSSSHPLTLSPSHPLTITPSIHLQCPPPFPSSERSGPTRPSPNPLTLALLPRRALAVRIPILAAVVVRRRATAIAMPQPRFGGCLSGRASAGRTGETEAGGQVGGVAGGDGLEGERVGQRSRGMIRGAVCWMWRRVWR